ncbi:hypothetical protein MHK12_10530 [Corynebacterium kefirresidentii]|uniref:hypothetical protein n=1 Tax=Corynebacterium TaxID=1716 RepID=UPI001EF32F36|nr:hypothetical protein [Corynebacterium kefirresidentii]MCG7450838.1 hypothetical protein [Corynebacterium kefirresidentii]MCG7453175.1 hypothetical protein [Corynebacterium kefirresidentii]
MTANDAPVSTTIRAKRFRRPGPTRGLIASMYGCVAVSAIFLILALALSSYWALLAMSIAMVLSCIPWTILRVSIDSKDRKPLSSLDEYEAQVLDQWRRKAFQLSTALLFTGGLVTLLVGNWFLGGGITGTIGTKYLLGAGYYLLFSYFISATLPAVGYALTFNQNSEN